MLLINNVSCFLMLYSLNVPNKDNLSSIMRSIGNDEDKTIGIETNDVKQA